MYVEKNGLGEKKMKTKKKVNETRGKEQNKAEQSTIGNHDSVDIFKTFVTLGTHLKHS